jgi:hypothetical protein
MRSPSLWKRGFLFYFGSYCTTAQEGDFYFEEDVCENYHSLSDDIYPHRDVLSPTSGIQNLGIIEK